MPKLTGVFDYFKGLDQIPATNINRWIHSKIDVINLRNFLGNRILYPQSVAFNKVDLEIDLAIFKEALSKNSNQFYSPSTKKIILPKVFLSRFAKATELMAAVVHAIRFVDLTTVYLNDEAGNMLAGSILVPQNIPSNGTFILEINGQKNQLKIDTLAIFPIYDHDLKIKADEEEMTVNGGVLGFAIDLRRR